MTQRRVFIAKAAGATAVVTLALLLAADPASLRAAGAPTLREGRHEGADFLIGMPAQWNGGLIMFAHGYEGESSGRGDVRGDPSGGFLTTRGYAWAASGYRSMGYRPDWSWPIRSRCVSALSRSSVSRAGRSSTVSRWAVTLPSPRWSFTPRSTRAG